MVQASAAVIPDWTAEDAPPRVWRPSMPLPEPSSAPVPEPPAPAVSRPNAPAPPAVKIVRRKEEAGWVYFIQQERSLLVKIGIARNAWTRMKNLQVGSPERLRILGSFQGTGQTEADLHAEFSALSVGGEWFRPDERLLSRIAELKAPPMLGMHMAKRAAGRITDPSLRFKRRDRSNTDQR